MIEYFNLFINKDIKDSDEMKALIRLVKKKQEEKERIRRIEELRIQKEKLERERECIWKSIIKM